MREKIILVGGGGHCRSVIDVIELEDRYEIVGVVDRQELVGESILGYKIIASDDGLEDIFKYCKNALVTVGQIKTNEPRVRLYRRLKEIGFRLPTIISPLAYVSKHASIEEGCVVMHHALLNAGVKIGRNSIINTKALIEHDSIVEEHCHISTAAVVNGGVLVKKNSFFGSNSMAREGIELAKNSLIGGGISVMRSR